MIRSTSLTTYLNEIAPTLGARQINVCEVFERAPDRDFTNSELAAALGWGINRVTGRVKELRGYGILKHSRIRSCGVTGRAVHAWRIADQPPVRPQSISPEPVFRQFASRSSRGGAHIVKQTGRHVACTCRGFYWRRTCRHVQEVTENPDPTSMMKPLFKM